MMISIFLDKVKFWFHEAAFRDRSYYASVHDFRPKTIIHSHSFKIIIITFMLTILTTVGFPFQVQAYNPDIVIGNGSYSVALEETAESSEDLNMNKNTSTPVDSSSIPVADVTVPQNPSVKAPPPPPAPTSTPNEAQAYAQTLVGTGEQWSCLYNLWAKESGWRVNAHNQSSGAYGIPQALPGSKMASVGGDWETNYATQIKWGLNYINSRYGSPCGAWQHSQQSGWY